MTTPLAGGCLCAAVRYAVDAAPRTVYVCHCTDCQRRTGSAFAISMIVARSAVRLTAGEVVAYHATLADGRTKNGRMCAACGTRLRGEPARNPAIAVVQPGTLDDPTQFAPAAHQWTRSALPWVRIPDDVARFETQPTDPGEYLRLWQNAARRDAGS